jgi:hypothetical protein
MAIGTDTINTAGLLVELASDQFADLDHDARWRAISQGIVERVREAEAEANGRTRALASTT